MIYDIADALVNSCFDRQAATKLNRFKYDEKIRKRWHELEVMQQNGQLRGDALGEYALFLAVHAFIGALQMKARSLLRRPVTPRPSTRHG